MLKIKYLKQEPNTVPLSCLSPGCVFKTARGDTPYMLLDSSDKLFVSSASVGAASLVSGSVHTFAKMHPVIELDGVLELHRVKIEHGRRDVRPGNRLE